MKFGQLILRKIIEIVAIRCQILRLKCTKFNFGWGSAPDPTGGAYNAPPDSLAGFKGPTSKERKGRERKGGEETGDGMRGKEKERTEREEGKGGGWAGMGKGNGGEGRRGEKAGDVEGPGKCSAPGPALALGGCMWLWNRDSEFTKWQHPAM